MALVTSKLLSVDPLKSYAEMEPQLPVMQEPSIALTTIQSLVLDMKLLLLRSLLSQMKENLPPPLQRQLSLRQPLLVDLRLQLLRRQLSLRRLPSALKLVRLTLEPLLPQSLPLPLQRRLLEKR